MHPAGIKFGLSHDLLEFRGADVVVSDRFFERISAAARRRIERNNRLTGLDLWDPVVSAGIREVLRSFGLEARQAMNLLVLITATGSAQPVAAGIDYEDWPEVIGTIAGDDTVLVICPDNRQAKALKTRIEGYIG